jgi:transposase
MLHRTRHLFIKQQTSVINSIRAHLAEFGIVARVAVGTADRTARCVRTTRRMPLLRPAVASFFAQWMATSPSSTRSSTASTSSAKTNGGHG